MSREARSEGQRCGPATGRDRQARSIGERGSRRRPRDPQARTRASRIPGQVTGASLAVRGGRDRSLSRSIRSRYAWMRGARARGRPRRRALLPAHRGRFSAGAASRACPRGAVHAEFSVRAAGAVGRRHSTPGAPRSSPWKDQAPRSFLRDVDRREDRAPRLSPRRCTRKSPPSRLRAPASPERAEICPMDFPARAIARAHQALLPPTCTLCGPQRARSERAHAAETRRPGAVRPSLDRQCAAPEPAESPGAAHFSPRPSPSRRPRTTPVPKAAHAEFSTLSSCVLASHERAAAPTDFTAPAIAPPGPAPGLRSNFRTASVHDS